MKPVEKFAVVISAVILLMTFAILKTGHPAVKVGPIVVGKVLPDTETGELHLVGRSGGQMTMPMWVYNEPPEMRKPMWGFILMTDPAGIKKIQRELGLKPVLFENFSYEKYARGTLPIYKDDGRFWDPTTKTSTTNAERFLLIVWLDGNQYPTLTSHSAE